jgi:hypothetical protein
MPPLGVSHYCFPLQFLPSKDHRAHISQAAKFDPSSKIYEVSGFGTLPAYKRLSKERGLLDLSQVSVLGRLHVDGLCSDPL